MTPKSKTALFAGTFRPFTIGHLRLVERALDIADHVVVALGYNERKGLSDDAENRVDHIRRIFKNNPRVSVSAYSGLTAEFARNVGADFMIRGVRTVADFEYERNLADINLRVLGIDTVLLCAEPEYSYISGSSVRELAANGHDISSFLPGGDIPDWLKCPGKNN